MEALDAVQEEGRAIVRQGVRTCPNGTALRLEPKGIRNGLGRAYDGGPEDGAEIKIRTGRYQYIVHCTRIAGTDNYVTTNREGGQPLCFTHTQTQATTTSALVHTKAMFSKHEWGTGQMRKAAIKSNGRTAVVWSTKARSLKSPEVLV